jgi:hypothetical protein
MTRPLVHAQAAAIRPAAPCRSPSSTTAHRPPTTRGSTVQELDGQGDSIAYRNIRRDSNLGPLTTMRS